MTFDAEDDDHNDVEERIGLCCPSLASGCASLSSPPLLSPLLFPCPPCMISSLHWSPLTALPHFSSLRTTGASMGDEGMENLCTLAENEDMGIMLRNAAGNDIDNHSITHARVVGQVHWACSSKPTLVLGKDDSTTRQPVTRALTLGWSRRAIGEVHDCCFHSNVMLCM